ncbi:hypothetical protein COLO4_15122 [Corchorus olitorius]|uniref:Uncharacterized protein n=1 Tax=Corchorus olitorius TaxID=93759 RepID=A0A1R3JPK4_9ROSI|nr:hypothetical protein COLO4_15122 [Corchorus olitorius]
MNWLRSSFFVAESSLDSSFYEIDISESDLFLLDPINVDVDSLLDNLSEVDDDFTSMIGIFCTITLTEVDPQSKCLVMLRALVVVEYVGGSHLLVHVAASIPQMCDIKIWSINCEKRIVSRHNGKMIIPLYLSECKLSHCRSSVRCHLTTFRYISLWNTKIHRKQISDCN